MPVSVSKLSRSLSEYLNRAAYGAERIVVTSRGNPKAAIVSIDDLRRLQDIEGWDPEDLLDDRDTTKAELTAVR
jgi:prevent-host-death family protein